MGLKSQRVGKTWENEIMDAYYEKGYQPFKLATETNGTCFDIILIKNAGVLCIEAKHIQGSKLYYKGCGLMKKTDEINHFVKHANTNVFIYVKSDETGTWFTSWLQAYPIFKEKGYITVDDCMKFSLECQDEK